MEDYIEDLNEDDYVRFKFDEKLKEKLNNLI